MPNKAVAAAGGGIAGALVTVVLALFWHTASPEIAAALTTIVSAALSGVATYFTPHNG